MVEKCRKAKKNYLELKLNKNKNDPKQMWGSLRKMLKGNSFSDTIYREIQFGDTIIKNT